MRIPIAYLTLFDYHYVSDIVDNKIGKRIEVPQSMLFELEPKLKDDILTQKKFGYAKSHFELVMHKNTDYLHCGLPRSTMYLLMASFFYEKIKDYDEDAVCNWRYEFDIGINVYDYLVSKVTPFLEDENIKNKVNRVMQQGLDRFISRVGLILEQQKEAEQSDGTIYNEEEIDTHDDIHYNLPTRRNYDVGASLLLNHNVQGSDIGTQSSHNNVQRLWCITVSHNEETTNSSNYIMLEDGLNMNFVVCDVNERNEGNAVTLLNFRGYYSDTKTYNRADSVIYNLKYFICLKSATFGEDIIGSKYWFKIPKEYVGLYTESIQCPPNDNLCFFQHNYMCILRIFDQWVDSL